jgi:uncharacterized protein involved in cysteine biosynthesis
LRGVLSLPRALGELWRTPALWGRALVPALVFFVLLSAFAALGLGVARPWLEARLPDATTTFGRIGIEAAGYGVALAVVILGWFASLALAPPLSAPALESIVGKIEASAGAPYRAPLGFFSEVLCGFRALCGALLVALPAFFVLWLLDVLVPVLTPLTFTLGSMLSSLLVAWGLFDYPLTLRGVGFRARLALVRENFACVLGFGLAFAFAFWLCCGLLLLPAGTIAATRLLGAILGWEDAGPFAVIKS